MRHFLTVIIFILSLAFFNCTHQKSKPILSAHAPSPDFHFDAQQFYEAVENGDLKKVEYALSNGISPNYTYKNKNDEMPVIILAVQAEKTEVVELLLKYGANVDTLNSLQNIGQRDLQTYTSLENVYRMGECAGSDDFSSEELIGVTPLALAAVQNNSALVSLLLDYGANPNLRTRNGNTILMLAAAKTNLEVVKNLIAHGADPIARGQNDETALMYAQPESIITLIKAGVQINAQTYDGNTVLMGRVCDGCLDVTKLLIENGAIVNLQNHFGETALMLAAGYRNEFLEDSISQENEIKKILQVVKKTKPLTQKTARDILILSQDRDYLLKSSGISKPNHPAEVVKFLIESGADVNLRDKQGFTALTYAKDSKNQEKIKMILSYGGVR
jgi:uncharacterized protein